MDKPVIIIGANGIGKAALDIFNSNGVTMYCFLDENEEKKGEEIELVSVMGSTEDHSLFNLIGKETDVFIASDEFDVKKDLVNRVRRDRKTMPVNAVHKNTSISSTSVIGHGNLLNSGVIIGAFSELGNHGLIHSGVIIDYDTKVGDYVQIGAGSKIASGVIIGDNVFIGTGVVIAPGIKIANNSRIGAGSVVVTNVDDGQTMFGNPAKAV